MYVVERWGESDKHPEKAISCDTLLEARVVACRLLYRVGDVVNIDRTTLDRMYTIEEVTTLHADRFSENKGWKTAYGYYIRKLGSKGHEYFEISKKTGKTIRKAYGISGLF